MAVSSPGLMLTLQLQQKVHGTPVWRLVWNGMGEDHGMRIDTISPFLCP